MQTSTELMIELASKITDAGNELLRKQSTLKRRPRDRDFIVLGSGDYSWEELSVEGRRLQSRLREEYDRFFAILSCLLRKQNSDVQDTLQQTYTTISELIEQQRGTYTSSLDEVFNEYQAAIEKQINILDALFDPAEGTHVYVPDTNALIYNPALEDWAFDDSPTFTLLVLPTVLSELDQLKVIGRDSVRDKANRLVRQFMEYRRRGSLKDGVILRKDRHSLRTVALEPDFNNTLPWLERENNDDRILAGVIEAMRLHPRCPVLLVTRDINLTNKSDYAQIPCVEPPEPIPQTQ
jgi:hypothetical protein